MATRKKSPDFSKLIVSNDKNPKIELQEGMKFKVETVQLVDPSLKSTKIGAARLCGGTSTCVAVIRID